MKTKLVCVLLLVLATALQLSGVLGVGDIVHDPTAYENDLLIYAQLIQSYQQLLLEYELLARMAEMVPVDMSGRYRAVATPWLMSYPPSDHFGLLAPWSTAINTGVDPLGGYAAATESLSEYGATLGLIPTEEQIPLKTNYASVELADGANLHSIETVGTLRNNAILVEEAIQALEDDSLSSDPAMNTEVAVLNKINAASIVALRNAQDSNKLLTAALEQQVTASKRERDGAAREINAYILRLQEAGRIWERHTGTMVNSMRNLRIP